MVPTRMLCGGKKESAQLKRPLVERPFDFFIWKLLDHACLLESEVRAALLHRLEALGRDGDSHLLVEFRDEKRLCLQIHLATTCAGRVEFGSARAVGIPTADLGFFTCYFADACHMWAHST